MHNELIEMWEHHHVFNVEKKALEKRTLIVVVITFATMIAEIVFGWITNSMALLADGWHMGTHAFALGVSLVAYIAARKYAKDERFAFGTWKIEILGAYTSAVVLGIVGALMIYSSVERFIHPLGIYYDQALLVAITGLAVNLFCVMVLNVEGHSHSHDNAHDAHHHEASKQSHQKNEDLNFKSAYLHVLADAFASVLAIVALIGAKYLELVWLDPFMGIVGAGLILNWAYRLMKDTGVILLQRETDGQILAEIRNEIESDGDSKISDLHVWRVAQDAYACIVSVVSARDYSIGEYKARLSKVHELIHMTVEINQCHEAPNQAL